MSNPEVKDQERIYREYFEVVKSFNSANAKYLAEINDIQQQRQMAIEQAIKEYLNPLISKLQIVQLITGAMILGAGLLFLIGLSLSGSSDLRAIGALMILSSLGGGVVGLLGIIWTSTKISALNSDKRRAKENLPKSPFQI